MAGEETDHFSSAGGVSNRHRVLEIEFPDDGEEVVGVSVYVVSFPRLTGTTVRISTTGSWSCDDGNSAIPFHFEWKVPVIED